MKRLREKCLECAEAAVSRGLCAVHYTRHFRAGTLKQFQRVYKTPDQNQKTMPNGCIEWTGDFRKSGGYGSIQVGYNPRRRVAAHRFFYERAHGAIPHGMFVCHSCDNPKCVNVAHLFLGTPEDNARDAARKNRMAVGRKHRSCKLTSRQVLAIRRSTKTYRELGEQYGVCGATIGEIKRFEIRVKEFIAGSNNGS